MVKDIKKITTAILVMLLISTSLTSPFLNVTAIPNTSRNFSDMHNHWAKLEVNKLSHLGIVSGSLDGTFKLSKKLQLDQFLKLVITSIDIEVKGTKHDYWAREYISLAMQNGLILQEEYSIYNEKIFKEKITRKEMARIITRALELKGLSVKDEHVDILKYGGIPDIKEAEYEFRDYIIKAYLFGLLGGRNNGSFDPHAYLTRSEGAVVINRLLSENLRTNIKPDISKFVATKVPVLMYHCFLPASENDGTNNAIVSVEDFKDQIHYLYSNNYKTITTKELKEFINGKRRLPKNVVLITMDDGYNSNFIYAYPILKQYNLRATMFPIAAFIGKEGDFRPRPALKTMKNSRDVFEFQAHTYNMHYVKNGKPVLLVSTKEDIYADFLKSNKITDKLNNNNTFTFAYPFGAFNEEIINISKKAGYIMGFTVREGFVRAGDDLMKLNRLNVDNGMTLEEFRDLLK